MTNIFNHTVFFIYAIIWLILEWNIFPQHWRVYVLLILRSYKQERFHHFLSSISSVKAIVRQYWSLIANISYTNLCVCLPYSIGYKPNDKPIFKKYCYDKCQCNIARMFDPNITNVPNIELNCLVLK